MIDDNYSIIVVTPVYEDLDASSLLFKELATRFGNDIFLVAVDDGSINKPLTIQHLHSNSINGVIIRLRRNVGHQRAIAVGMWYVSENMNAEQRVIVMDSDGEDLPASIPLLLEQLDTQFVDIVVAERKNRYESTRFKIFYIFYKLIFKFLTGRVINFGNFMALKPLAILRLVSMQELSLHVAAGVLASRMRVSSCPLDRGPRYAGQSKMNFVGLVLHGFKALMIFAEDVLVRVGVFSAGVALFSIFSSFAAIGLKLFGFATPGWFSIALGILVLMFIQTGMLALITLMLTGVVRSGSVSVANSYQEFILEVVSTLDLKKK